MQVLHPYPPTPRSDAIDTALHQAHAALGGEAPDLVLVNDPQRATASHEVLSRVGACFDLSRVNVLVATGSHHFTASEQRTLERAFSSIRLGNWDWHDARRPDLAAIDGAGGWHAHPWVKRARRLLVIGSVEPHYSAGFSGAHKTVTVGCASLADITRNHAGALDPACRPCRRTGTPVHDGVCDMLALLEASRQVAAVNLLQIGSTIVDAAGGPPLAALEELVPKVKAAYLRQIPRQAEALVAEVSGALACSFYQAEKGIKNSEWAVRDGGTIVLQAACPQGIGQNAFMELLREAGTHAEAVALIRRRGYRLGDHKAVRLRHLTDPACRGIRVFVVSPGLTPDEAALLGVTWAESARAALQQAGVDPEGPGVYHVEDAGNTCVEAEA